MAFTQIVRPGAPVVYGGFTSNVDMLSGAPAFGTPEYVRTAMLGGQLARRYNVGGIDEVVILETALALREADAVLHEHRSAEKLVGREQR